jgi:hypothetical protein
VRERDADGLGDVGEFDLRRVRSSEKPDGDECRKQA